MQRRRFKQTTALDERLKDLAKHLRNKARGTPPGTERETLILKARQAETAVRIEEWLKPPGLRPPE